MSSNGAATPSLETTREAEKRVLGAVLQGGTAVYAGLNTIIPDASVFSHEQFSVVWESARRLHDRGQDVDTITVVAELEESGLLDRAGGAPVVRSYPSVLESLHNAPTHARLVVDRHHQREQLRTSKRLQEAVVNGNDITPLLSELQQRDAEGPSARAATNFQPIGEALAGQPAAPDWYLEGFAAPGVLTLIAGRPKAGKTSLLFGVLNAITHGSDFAGLATRETGALLLTEERAGTIADKYRRWPIKNVDIGYRHAETLPWPRLIGAAIKHCNSAGHGLLIVDTFGAWSDLAGDAENSAAAVGEAMKPLLVAAGNGLAVVVIHHQRKAAGSHGEAIRGSNALAGAVDVLTELERGTENTRVLKSISRFADATPERLYLTLAGNTYQAAAPEESAETSILEAIEAGCATQHSISEQTGHSIGHVSRTLRGLEDGSVITSTGTGGKSDPKTYSLVASAK